MLCFLKWKRLFGLCINMLVLSMNSFCSLVLVGLWLCDFVVVLVLCVGVVVGFLVVGLLWCVMIGVVGLVGVGIGCSSVVVCLVLWLCVGVFVVLGVEDVMVCSGVVVFVVLIIGWVMLVGL